LKQRYPGEVLAESDVDGEGGDDEAATEAVLAQLERYADSQGMVPAWQGLLREYEGYRLGDGVLILTAQERQAWLGKVSGLWPGVKATVRVWRGVGRIARWEGQGAAAQPVPQTSHPFRRVAPRREPRGLCPVPDYPSTEGGRILLTRARCASRAAVTAVAPWLIALVSHGRETARYWRLTDEPSGVLTA
jgi:hypothetical protein